MIEEDKYLKCGKCKKTLDDLEEFKIHKCKWYDKVILNEEFTYVDLFVYFGLISFTIDIGILWSMFDFAIVTILLLFIKGFYKRMRKL